MSDILTGLPAVKFIAGQCVPSRGASVYERRSRRARSQTLGRLPSSHGADVAAAVGAPVEAERTWSRQDA